MKILALNGVEDHLHCLLRLPSILTVAQTVKHIKGESLRWLNSSKLIEGTFSWQEGYGAFSVSPQRTDKIKLYIYNQEQHHQNLSYEEEAKVFGL